MNTFEYLAQVQSNPSMALDHTARLLDACKKLNESHHFFNTLCSEQALHDAKNVSGKLAGLCISVKDCICVKGVESTAGSKALKGYSPLFDATVIDRLKQEGAIIIGKTSQDEFGFGGFNVNVGNGFSIPKNPLDDTRSCGGSSGGSAGITQALSKFGGHMSLAESTGGSIAAPASFCGVVGFTPTYGRVSRYGLIDYGNSLDKIGPMGMSMQETALLLSVFAGHDAKDSTCASHPVPDYVAACNQDCKGTKIGLITNADEEIQNYVNDAAAYYESQGAIVEKVDLPLASKYGVSAYYLLAMSEASTNLAKYCGMRYGFHGTLKGGFNEYFSETRTTTFGKEAKRRLLIGTYARMAGYRDAFYLKALKVRTKIIEEYKTAFKNHDVLLSPTMPMIAPKFEDIEKLTPHAHYMADKCTAPVNLAGLPHVSLTCGTHQSMPVGMMLIADHFKEEKLCTLGSAYK